MKEIYEEPKMEVNLFEQGNLMREGEKELFQQGDLMLITGGGGDGGEENLQSLPWIF